MADSIVDLFEKQRHHRWRVKSQPIAQRKVYLKRLLETIWKHEEAICAAHFDDFEKPATETLITEIYPVIKEINYVLRNLNAWSAPEKIPGGVLLLGTTSEIRYEPKGNILIIAPWNYPFSLSFVSLVSAIGAGNTVMIKPSELTPKVSHLIARIISEVFPQEIVTTVQGGIQTSQDLLNLPFDHIFFTGSTPVGKIVMEKASKHLSSVTLELGGKSPAFVHESCDLELSAQKIVWGKFLNAGQTCVAPDYAFVDEKIFKDFVFALQKYLKHSFGEDPTKSESYASIISEKHFGRLKELVEEAMHTGAEVYSIHGKVYDLKTELKSELRFPPLLVLNPSPHIKLMKEEIFGPVLPLLTMTGSTHAIEHVRKNPKPLALYVFAKDKKWIENILSQTSSGGVCVNDTVLHLGNHDLPFGGTGESGMGNYHGEFGFKTFSHARSVLKQGWMSRAVTAFYPPYITKKYKLFRYLMKLGF